MYPTIFFSILTRNHGKFLPNYFRCLEEMNYDKKNIVVYINTNNNDDKTLNLLCDWVENNSLKYRNIIFEKGIDDHRITKDLYWDHENNLRLKKMAAVRNRSLEICKLEKTDYYFVMDTDNWVCSDTLIDLVSEKKPIIAPFIKRYDESSLYSNYFCKVSSTGYYEDCDEYKKIWHRQEMKGTFKVPLVHCTYMIDCNYLNKMSYTSSYWGDHHYEFVIFANTARENNVDQYISNKKMFGFVDYTTIIDKPNSYDLLLNKYNQDNLI